MKKINPGHVLVAGCCLALMLGVGFGIGITLKATQASRNSAGTYSLATSPVVSSQVITPSLWNNTFLDLAADMTLSLDRNGRGGMLAPLRSVDGTLAAPSFSFTSETGSGLFRNGAGDVRMALLGANVEQWAATGPIVPSGKMLGIGAAPTYALDVFAGSGTQARFGSTITSGGLSINNRTGVDPRLESNAVFDGVSDKYMQTGAAGLYQMPGVVVGDHVFYTAPSGTAGTAASFTERFRVSATGSTVGSPGFATGIPADGSGFKHKRFGSLCTTAAASLAACTDALTWTTAFANASYTVTCTADGISLGAPFSAGISAKTASGFTHTTLSYGSTFGAQLTAVDCIAVHD